MAGPTTAQEAGRPQPQTTGESNGGPFLRHSQPGRWPIYNRTGDVFGGVITQPLVARPGYFRNFRVTRTFVTGGAITSGVIQPDAPYNSDALVQLKDAFGTPLVVCDGYTAALILSVFGGHFGQDHANNFPANLPSFAAISNTTGAGSYSYALPLEFATAIGVLSGANASLLPTIQFNLNSATSVFGGGSSGTYPTITTQVDADGFWLPETVAVEPPGLGTTRQWQTVQANPTVAANSSARVQFPRLGGYLTDLIAIVRDNTGARNDTYWPSRIQLYVDGVAYFDSTMTELYDDMAIQYGYGNGVNNGARPSGVIAFSRRTSLSQRSLGKLDTGEQFLSTNPATLIELNGSPWGAGTNSPAQVNIVVGQVIPVGAVIQGLPEV